MLLHLHHCICIDTTQEDVVVTTVRGVASLGHVLQDALNRDDSNDGKGGVISCRDRPKGTFVTSSPGWR